MNLNAAVPHVDIDCLGCKSSRLQKLISILEDYTNRLQIHRRIKRAQHQSSRLLLNPRKKSNDEINFCSLFSHPKFVNLTVRNFIFMCRLAWISDTDGEEISSHFVPVHNRIFLIQLSTRRSKNCQSHWWVELERHVVCESRLLNSKRQRKSNAKLRCISLLNLISLIKYKCLEKRERKQRQKCQSNKFCKSIFIRANNICFMFSISPLFFLFDLFLLALYEKGTKIKKLCYRLGLS